MASSSPSPRPRLRLRSFTMKPTKTGIEGRLYRVKKTCARVRLLGLDGEEARIDIAIVRRILGIGVNDLRDVLRRSAHVHVDVSPMKEAPRIFQRSSCPWNVVDITLSYGDPAAGKETAHSFSNPSAYFIGRRNMQIPFKRSRPLIKPELTGMVVDAVWQIFAEMDGESLDVQELLEKMKKRFPKTELPVLHSESKSLGQRFRRYFMTMPLYFTLRWGSEQGVTMVWLHPRFSEADIQKEICRRSLVLFRRRRRRRSSRRSRSGSTCSEANSTISLTENEDDSDVIEVPVKKTSITGRIPVVNESAKCAAVVDSLLKDAAKSGMLVISLDCQGSTKDDGKVEVNLVQLSTLEGEVWLFDVIESEDKSSMMKEGRLKEFLEADIVMKVMHDCHNTAATLFRQFGVKLFNVFDTSLAFETLLRQCNVDPSKRETKDQRIGKEELFTLLGEKHGIEDCKVTKKVLENNPHMWDERPLSDDLTQYAAGTVQDLVPRVFNKLDRLLHPSWQQYFDWLCEDTLIKAQSVEE